MVLTAVALRSVTGGVLFPGKLLAAIEEEHEDDEDTGPDGGKEWIVAFSGRWHTFHFTSQIGG